MSEHTHPPQGGQPKPVSPWKTPKTKIFWPMVAGAVVLWVIVAVIVWSSLYPTMGRGVPSAILVGLGGLLVYGVRAAEDKQRIKDWGGPTPPQAGGQQRPHPPQGFPPQG